MDTTALVDALLALVRNSEGPLTMVKAVERIQVDKHVSRSEASETLLVALDDGSLKVESGFTLATA